MCFETSGIYHNISNGSSEYVLLCNDVLSKGEFFSEVMATPVYWGNLQLLYT